MITGTGKTIYEQILSVNEDGIPVTGTTFDIAIYRNGALYTGVTTNILLTDEGRGIFIASWSASTVGDYQLYAKNNDTSVVFISDNISIKSNEELSTNVYIGL